HSYPTLPTQRCAHLLGQLLAALGIRAQQIREEQRQIEQIVFARTINRSILGTMNDFDRMLDPAPGQTLASAALERCLYSPALLADGRAVEVDYIFSVKLQLHDWLA